MDTVLIKFYKYSQIFHSPVCSGTNPDLMHFKAWGLKHLFHCFHGSYFAGWVTYSAEASSDRAPPRWLRECPRGGLTCALRAGFLSQGLLWICRENLGFLPHIIKLCAYILRYYWPPKSKFLCQRGLNP